MVKKRPLLSICIPTYNRADVLDVVLQHYVDNPEFDEHVELIISDNASTDTTEDVCKKYVQNCRNIRYYRNKENICDANFYTVLNYADGEYIKLLNDCVYMDAPSLKYLKDAIQDHLVDRFVLFFTNDYLYTRDVSEYMECSNLDEYMQKVSTYITCNNLFGAWKEDWEAVSEKSKYSQLKLTQVDWTCQIVSKKSKTILYNKTYLTYPDTSNMLRGGYNWFQIHLVNYYTILEPYHQRGLISDSTIKKDKRYLIDHFKGHLYRIFILHRDSQYDPSGTLSMFWEYCRKDWFFYYYFLTLPLRFVVDKIPHIPQIFKRTFHIK